MTAPKLERLTFVVSRGLEYFTQSELAMQIGTARSSWPAAILKELADNALDAADADEVPPEVHVSVGADEFSVRDNGPGIPLHIIKNSLDYMVRVSDKLSYVTPTRGRLGNALKVVWAAPFVANGESRVVVRARGLRHDIAVSLDEIEQQPRIEHRRVSDSLKKGTEFRLHWPDSASCLRNGTGAEIYKSRVGPRSANEIIQAFHAFNPHASFTLDGEVYSSTDPAWRKWSPTERLVAHWYRPDTFRDLVANVVASERYGAKPMTVRAFVASFRGLSSTQKQKAVTDGLQRDYLHEWADHGTLDQQALGRLLGRMQELSKPPKPNALGVLGSGHITRWLVEQARVTPESVRYVKKVSGTKATFPYVIEVGFGVSRDDHASRRIVTGLNWSPTLDVPAPEIRTILQDMRVDPDDPVAIVIHMARPSWTYTERGKGAVEL